VSSTVTGWPGSRADGVEAEIVGPGTSPDRHQDLVGFDPLAVAEIDLHIRADAADAPRLDRDPHGHSALDRDSSTCSPANGSSRASRRSPASISVTLEPSAR
jgi:hypothetical protein